MAMYDSFAEAFDAKAVSSAYNAHYDRPALLRLLGDVRGLHVLDAGCGSGLYAHELLERGARVVGVDASAELVRLARARCDGRAQFHVQDLCMPLAWAADRCFDRVVCALVLHHLARPDAALAELHRVLTDDGVLVVSTVHPTADWLRLGGSYFTDEVVSETWNDGWQVRFRRCSLGALVDDFADAGFTVDALVEPRPEPSMADAYPDVERRLQVEPGFISFRLSKRRDTVAR